MVIRLAAIRRLLDCFEQPFSCVILGAGASAPLVPMVTQLREMLRRRVLTFGVYPATPVERDELSDKMLGPRRLVAPWDEAGLIEEELIADHVHPHAIRAAVVALLRPKEPDIAPVQYGAFRAARHPLTLINFNNDGLASRFCVGHRVINIHGTSLSAQTRERVGWEEFVEAAQEFGVSMPGISGLVMPGPERLTIAATPEYAVAHRALCQARRTAIVGYSFGGMDDIAAYGMVRARIRDSGLPVVVVSPDADELAGRLCHDSRSNDVLALPAMWQPLASAIAISSREPAVHRNCHPSRLCSRCVAYWYELMLDGGPRADQIQHGYGSLVPRYGPAA